MSEVIVRQSDIIDQIREILLSASVDASPENYELCHRYVTSTDPEVRVAFEYAIKEQGSIDAAAFQRIRDAAGPPRGQINAERHMAALDAQIAQLLTLTDQAKGDTETYSLALETAAVDLNSLNLADDAAAIVTHLIGQTVMMSRRANVLEENLANASGEMSGLRDELERAKRESGSDALTSLPNRRAFDSRLDDAIAVADASRQALSLAFLDIDHFKKFNDAWGHKLGDQVLRFVGSQLAKLCGEVGLPARYGGEEFVVLLPDHGAADAMEAVKRVCEAVSSRIIRTRTDNREVGRITLSAGVATRRRGENAEALVERADAAMYQAKEAGRDRVITSV